MDGLDVAKISLPYLKAYKDRHGKPRFYVRLRGRPQVAIPDPTTPEGFAAYHAAVDSPREPKRPTRATAGSVDALLSEFYASDYWLNTLKPNTQANYRNILERWRTVWGHNPVSGLTRKDVQAMLADRASTPGAARNFLKRMRTLFDFAVDQDYRTDNPFRTVKLKPLATEGFIPWSDAEIEQFKAHHAPGTRARRAMALLLYTTQRRSDVHRMGRQHVVNGHLSITQVKGRKGVPPVQLLIPIHPELQAELDLMPPGEMQFITTLWGKPFSAAGFTSWFVEQAQASGLRDRTPHGLRKAGARHHAEAGSGAPQIAAVTGHKSLSEVERYIRSAAQPRLAKLAMDTLAGANREHEMSNPEPEDV